MTNQKFAETNEIFGRACVLAHTPPTKRQASKFRNDQGKAVKFRYQAAKEVSENVKRD